MSNKPHTLLACFEAKPGKEQALKEALMALVEPTLQEEGCLNYDLHQCKDNPGRFMFYENWSSVEAHAKHCQTPHLQIWRSKKQELLANAEVSAWQMLR